MATIRFECKPSKKNKKGKSPILLCISSQNKRAYIQLNIHISPSRWNQSGQQVRKFKTRVTNSEAINAELSDIKTKALQIIKQNPEATSASLKKLINQKNNAESDDEVNLLTFAEKQNSLIAESSYNYFKRRQTAINHLSKYTQNKGILISEIDKEWIYNFHNYLTLDLGQAKNTATKSVRVLSQFFNILIKEDLTQLRNPFELVKFKKEKTLKEKLSQEELTLIKELQLKKGSLIWHVRNYFLAQIYAAGCRISDLAVLQKKNISGDRIYYKMQKTKNPISVLITEPLRQILEMYQEMYPDNPNIFPLIDQPFNQFKNNKELKLEISRKTALCNKYLKKIQKQAGIQKTITTHIARHTFADLARKNGWSIYDISKALNHSSLKITENYLAELDTESLDKGMKGLFG